jgi:DnaJ-class molecular chaperone
MNEDNHYKTLEIQETANSEEIKKAYRKLSLQHHPDKNHGNDISGKFQKINEAYEILKDDKTKAQYDAERNNPFAKMGLNMGMGMGGMGMNGMNMGFNQGQGQGQGIDEFLANLFFGGQGHSQMHHGQMHHNLGQMNMGFFPPGGNIKIFRNGQQVNMQQGLEKPTPIVKTVDITMEQVLNGATIPVEIERWLFDNGNKIFECETLYVQIPKGIDDKEIIMLKDKGNILNEQCKGDVKIFIKIDNTSDFKRQGLDLILEKDITLKEALCGFSFELKYINGKTYTINNTMGNIIKPEYKKVIPNMGLEREQHKGSIIIVFHVIFPDTMDVAVLEKIKDII